MIAASSSTPRQRVTIELIRSRVRRRQPWRWVARADNGKKVAVSGEHYTNREDCIDAIALVFGGGPASLREVMNDGVVMTTHFRGVGL